MGHFFWSTLYGLKLRNLTSGVYRVDQKKCPIAIFSLNLFQRSDLTFSHVFRNQNFEAVPSKHFKHTHSEYSVP